MNKVNYVTPEMEVVEVEVKDLITVSLEFPGFEPGGPLDF